MTTAALLLLLAPACDFLAEHEALKKSVDQILSRMRSGPDPGPSTVTAVLPPEARIAGKLVLVDGESRQIHSWQFSLPETLRARTPAEISAIVLLQERTDETGSAASWLFSTRGPGGIKKHHRLQIRVVSATTAAILVDGQLFGQFPARRRAGRMIVSSSKPDLDDLLGWLTTVAVTPRGK
jgi:hypothetical protein